MPTRPRQERHAADHTASSRPFRRFTFGSPNANHPRNQIGPRTCMATHCGAEGTQSVKQAGSLRLSEPHATPRRMTEAAPAFLGPRTQVEDRGWPGHLPHRALFHSPSHPPHGACHSPLNLHARTHRTRQGHSPRNMTRQPSCRTLSTMVRRRLKGLPLSSALCMRVFHTSKGNVIWRQWRINPITGKAWWQ